MKYSRNLLGTRCSIEILDCDFSMKDIETSFALIENFEKNYSRFLRGNILSKLNKEKKHSLTKELKVLIEIGVKLGDISKGYFDITILPYLENAGYGIEQERLEENIGYKHIILSESEVQLENSVSIEFGAYGKGYILDRVYNYLREKYAHFILDFGGDIKVMGKREIHLENPGEDKKYYGVIELENASIASSNGLKRKFGNEEHHLINIKNGKSSNDVYTVFCCHSKGVFADGFATVLSVSPKKVTQDILKRVPGLEALIVYADGSQLRSGRFISL
ncbi:FAD:protein FMN transferase [Candidatus Gracilibacteria bacterium]|nr:FAD:protein FMN transferase [Candidatus Gracilibacteria bacterium]